MFVAGMPKRVQIVKGSETAERVAGKWVTQNFIFVDEDTVSSRRTE